MTDKDYICCPLTEKAWRLKTKDKAVLKYFAKDEGMLSFANNKPVKIFSKGAGSNPNLWGVMVRN